MRRLAALLFSLAVVASGASAVATAPPAGAQVPPDDPSRGLIYAGLQRAGLGSACPGLFEVLTHVGAGQERLRCTHGPDPVPPDVDPRPGQDPSFGAGETAPANTLGTAADAAAVGCFGDGGDAYRVQLMYAREASAPDRFDQFQASFRKWAARIDDVFETSAAKTGGIRHIRYVTDASCQPVIDRVVISSAAVDNVGVMQQEFDNANIDRTDRKYLVWVDTPKPLYCGQAFYYPDDTRPDRTPGLNSNNGNTGAPGVMARVDTRCWGQQNLTEAHEMLHMLGGVLSSPSDPAAAPPHATNHGHCTDESDRLCYADGDPNASPVTGPVFRADGTPTSLQRVCPASNEALLDCGNDDYFSTNPPAGNWLAAHWNAADSAWLATGPPPGTPGSTAAGSAWFTDGTKSHHGPAGTTVKVFATNAVANVPYQLVTGRNGVVPSQPCALDLVAVNPSVVVAGPNGLIPAVTGPVNRLPGAYQVCFAQTDPVSGQRVVTGVSTFTVE